MTNDLAVITSFRATLMSGENILVGLIIDVDDINHPIFFSNQSQKEFEIAA